MLALEPLRLYEFPGNLKGYEGFPCSRRHGEKYPLTAPQDSLEHFPNRYFLIVKWPLAAFRTVGMK